MTNSSLGPGVKNANGISSRTTTISELGDGTEQKATPDNDCDYSLDVNMRITDVHTIMQP